MNKLLKILGFIGSLAVGIATVNYFMKLSKSDVSPAVVGLTSAQTVKSENKTQKISRLAKIEQNYQPKDFEEIPVEYVQIATCDIDEGKKLPVIDTSARTFTDKVVKVEQGGSFPFFSSGNSQPNVPVQSVNPQENYYPESYYDHGANYTPRNNQISHNDVDQSPVQAAQSQVEYPVDQQPEHKKSHFRNVNDDLSSLNNVEYNPGMLPVKQELQNSEQPVNSQGAKAQDSKLDWKNLLNGFLNSLGGFAGGKALEYLYNKLTGQAEPSVDGHILNPAQVDILPESTNTSGFNSNLTSECPVRHEPEQRAQSTANESKTTESTEEKAQQKVHKAESKPGVVDTNITPDELSPVRKDLNNIGSGQKAEMFIKARSNLNISHVAPTEIIEANPVALEQKNIELPKSRSGIVETIDAQEIIELPIQEPVINQSMPKSRSGISQGKEVIELPEMVNPVSLESKKMHKLESRKGVVETIHPEEVEILVENQSDLLSEQAEGKSIKQMHQVNQEDMIKELSVQDSKTQPAITSNNNQESYFTRTWNYFINKDTAKNLDRLLASNEGGAVLALGLATVAAPCLAISALTTAVAPVVAAPALVSTAVAPALASTAVTTTATGLMSYASGAKALMAAKALVGIAGFAVTKNPMYLLPK